MDEKEQEKILKPIENIQPETGFTDEEVPLKIDFANEKLVMVPTQTGQRLDIDLNDATSSAGGAFIERVSTFTSADATPSVKHGGVFITAGTTSVTDFDDGVVGQTIKILATANIVITDNANIILSGSANYSMTDTDTLTLTMFNDQVWSEINRSVN